MEEVIQANKAEKGKAHNIRPAKTCLKGIIN